MTTTSQRQGIDVSHYQGIINWPQVKAAGIVYAYAKATDGITYTDPNFAANWQNMQAAGVLRGAYHFYETGDDPVAQAQHFIDTLGRLSSDDLAPVVDIEALNGSYGGNSVAANLQTWLDTVASACGRRPMIYTNPGFWNHYVAADFSAYPLWVADYGVRAPQIPTGWTEWTLWQYSQQGSVDGVAGYVDLDVSAGSITT